MNYFELNKKGWNNWATVNFESKFYDVPAFLKGKNSLNSIELELLGDVKDLKILHLQCHFGQDTLSLSRMGAKTVGVDLSDEAINKAVELNDLLGLDARFITCNVYDLKDHLDEKFDLVFSSYGTIGWLPDIKKWAEIVAFFLKPGGKFVFAEFHPVVWMFDDALEKVTYTYLNGEPIIETSDGSYADPKKSSKVKFASWNHGLSEVIQALIDRGIELNIIREFDFSPYDVFQGTKEIEPGKYIIEKYGNKLPLVYALKGTKT